MQQIDLTQVSLCKQTMRKFKTRVKSCIIKTGCEGPRIADNLTLSCAEVLKTNEKLLDFVIKSSAQVHNWYNHLPRHTHITLHVYADDLYHLH